MCFSILLLFFQQNYTILLGAAIRVGPNKRKDDFGQFGVDKYLELKDTWDRPTTCFGSQYEGSKTTETMVLG